MPAADPLATGLARRFLEQHPREAALVLDELGPTQAVATLTRLELTQALALLGKLTPHFAARTLEQAPTEQVAAWLEALPLRNAVEIFGRLKASTRQAAIEQLSVRRAQALLSGLQRIEESVAGMMDTHILQLPEDARVRHATALLERQADLWASHLYVTDNAGQLSGILTLRQIYTAHPDQRLSALSLQAIPRLPADARVAPVLAHPGWLRYTRLPVVDNHGQLLGELRRERLYESASAVAGESKGPLGMALALLEAYTAANLLILDLLVGANGRRGSR